MVCECRGKICESTELSRNDRETDAPSASAWMAGDEAEAATAEAAPPQLPPPLPLDELSEFVGGIAANSTPTEKSVQHAQAKAKAMAGGGQVGLASTSLKNIINACMGSNKYLNWSVSVGEGASAEKLAFIYAVGEQALQVAAVQKKKILVWCKDRKTTVNDLLTELGSPVHRSLEQLGTMLT